MTDIRDDLQGALGTAFTVKRELGGGGMSRVFLVHDEALDRDVVIKVLMPELAATLSVERFTREIKLAASLQQANIVPVLSAGAMISGLPYYVMPWVDGSSLRDRLNGDAAIQLKAAVKILGDVGCALEYAHARGVVHRDIKPENILLSGGTAVVTDFGIAKAITASKTQAPGGTLTVVGTSLGTPAYMAPEQAVGDSVDQRADIYAWGIVAYELLSGKHPFGDKTTAQQLIAAHIAEKPPALNTVRRDIPLALSSLVMSTLEKNPDNRPQSAQVILRALDDSALLGTTPTEIVSHAPALKTSATGKKVLQGAVIVMMLAIGVIAVKKLVTAKSDAPGGNAAAPAADSSINTVAVLPFVNTSGNPQDEYFSDGMTDELARALSKIPEMRVASRTSAYSFKGKAVPVQDIGKALNVRGVVEGTVRRAGSRLRVTAQLTNANTGLVVWTDAFEREASNVFQVQDELTAAIVGALSSKLRPEAKQSLASQNRGTSDPESYDLYLRGRFNWNKRKADAIEDAMVDLKKAIERDPKFARAHAALASSYAILPQYSTKMTKGEGIRLGTISASRALELDPTLAEPHSVLGFLYLSSWEWEKSEAEFKKAIQADSTFATTYQWYAFLQFVTGRLRESIATVKRARSLDPLSHVIADNLCGRALLVNERAAGEAACRDAAPLLDGQAMFALFDHKWDEAADKFRRYGEPYSAQGFSAYALAMGGHTAEARAKLKVFRAAGGQPMNVALIYLGLGEKDSALVWLDRAVDAKENALTTTAPLLIAPAFDPFRGDPRFEKLIDRMGLRPYAAKTK